MLNTFEDALRWADKYGGIRASVEELKASWTTVTCGQLRAIASHALEIEHRPKEEVERAMILIIYR